MTDAYEVDAFRSNGSVYAVEVLGEWASDDDAAVQAQHCADLWQHPVNLYCVPFINIGAVPWAESDRRFVCRIEPGSDGAPFG
jgi:hypothetical protein